MSLATIIQSAPLETILASGGDTRSTIDSHTGLNRFGCAPFPRPEALSFGSATASSISKHAFQSVETVRRDLLDAHSPVAHLDEQWERLRHQVLDLLGISRAACDVVFSPSGTDSALHALFLTRALFGNAGIDCVLVGSDETGTGIPLALTGRHFSNMTAEGVPVPEYKRIPGLSEDVTLRSLPIRQPGGSLRPMDEIDADVSASIAESVRSGRKVLLQVMDCSKLGARAPSMDCLRSIHRRFGSSVQVVVDACQMRTSRTRLQWYLDQGDLVLISGSKFFTGPPFSGAMLVPGHIGARFAAAPIRADGLADYTNRMAWPQAWTSLRNRFADRPNVGQFFRWVAAVYEMQAYFAVPWAFRETVLNRFASLAVETFRRCGPDLTLMDEGHPRNEQLDDGEMSVRTIFPFLVESQGSPLTLEQARVLHDQLNRNAAPIFSRSLGDCERAVAEKPCHLGQPVAIAAPGGAGYGALRLCAGSRTVTSIWARYQSDPRAVRMAAEQSELDIVLDKIRLLASGLSSR